MKALRPLYAKFPTTFRGLKVVAELRAVNERSAIFIEAQFYVDDVPFHVTDMTRSELAQLCREAAHFKGKH